jgi:uncharacterized protein (TIGR02246 family)
MLNRFFCLLAVVAFACQAQTTHETNEDAIRKLISTFSMARNAHDGKAVAALYTEDGEWMTNNVANAVRGRAALTKLWNEVKGSVDRKISSIDFSGSNVAIVHVTTQYEAPIGLHSEMFVLVNDGPGGWKIKIHQTLD